MTPNLPDRDAVPLAPTPPAPAPPVPTPLVPAPLTPATLLSGPRGRRLCLELAAIYAQQESDGGGSKYGSAAFFAAHAMDPDRGSSRVLFGPSAADPPQPTAGEVAALLDAVALPELVEENLQGALGAMVNTARYWQEPDGEDVLAASAPMRRALQRIAAHLLDSPLTRWWTTPKDHTGQWTVDFVDDPPHPPAADSGKAPRTAADTLAHWRGSLVDEEQGATIDRPSDPAANFSGTWWSRPPWDLPTSTRAMPGQGPLGLHLVEDAFNWEEAVAQRLSVPAGVRILEIDSPGVWAQLCREHPLEVTASKRHDWYRTTGRDGAWVAPDWAALKDKYDGVHLTMGGYLTTAGVAIPVDGDHASVLAGWDPDATYWLRDMGLDANSRHTWARVRDYPAWSRLDQAQGSGTRSLTAPARSSWTWNHGDYQGWSGTEWLGTGEEVWQRVSRDVLNWKVKTRSGFSVDAEGPVVPGQRLKITAHFFGLKVVEPVEVLDVVDEPDRVGFSYRTLPGHPVSGEEAFIVHRDHSGHVHLSIRSLTRAAPQQPWRAMFPALVRIQKTVRKRYLRALR